MKASDIKKGNVVEYNNGVYQIRDIERRDRKSVV